MNAVSTNKFKNFGKFLSARTLQMSTVNISPTATEAGNYCISFDDVKKAHFVIKPYVHQTPLMTCSFIDKLCGRNVFMKTENLQKTGSFKIRGATNAVASLVKRKNKPDCIVTHSSGNHGQAVAKAANNFHIPAYIVMPSNAPECKKNAVKSYGGFVVECAPTEKAREQGAEKVCREKGGSFIHASQTAEVISGQGTIAFEMLKQNPDLDAIVVPVGGGGMISGITIAAKHIKPSIKIYAAEPEKANDCYLSKCNGYITPVDHPVVTIADGVKVTIGENAWPIIRDLVDDVITVSEEQIIEATRLVWERAKLVIEPTSGVGIAAIINEKFSKAKGMHGDVKNIGVVLCGGNADVGTVAKILTGV
ncbi:serine racemase-like [Clavelina lepadiformis]|uniref:serine racemase-like n=1 Tax=Clavelina lepadiformis TaxID=159417 RepID=UPI004042CDB8